MVARSSTASPDAKPAPKRRPPPVAKAAPAADAAAASFAALTGKLDYLDAGDIRRVREAYRFADEAHLGQFRASGEPYITHPIAVAGLCAEWKLDAQAIMAALMHDAMEDCGITKAELIERFGAPTADLVDGLTKLDKLSFSTREESQAESFRKMLLAMTRDVRVILVKLADRLHNMRTMDAVDREKRMRVAGETLDIYAPIAHRLGLNQTYRELQELSFKHLKPWREAALSKAVLKARGYRRDLVERIQRDVEKAFANAKLPAQIFGREKTIYSIYAQDAREAPELRPGERHLRLSRRRRHALRVLRRDGRAAPALQAGAGPLQGLHRDPQGQRLPVAAHHPGEPARHRGRVPDPHRADARRRREGHRRALALQGARRRPRPGGAAPGRDVAAVAARHPGRDPRRQRVPRARQDRSLPRRGLRVHAEVEDPGPAARRHAGRLRLRDPLRHRRPLRRRLGQRRAGAAAHRAAQRRRGRDRRRAERPAEPGLAELRLHRPGALARSATT